MGIAENQRLVALENRRLRAARHAARMRLIKQNKAANAECHSKAMTAKRWYAVDDVLWPLLQGCNAAKLDTDRLNQLSAKLADLLRRAPKNIQQEVCEKIVYEATVTCRAEKRGVLQASLEHISRACGFPCPVIAI